ncbi:MAG: GNAT family N-acetyltransferase [Armatimonadetes bacterium]|nr:GNAT family N-acetyltransferase [Armatimonadota bacterium]
MPPFVPKDFAVPATLKTNEFHLRMLTVNDVVKDFDAVITSVDHCKTIWGGKWPEGLTLEQNLIDLGWHQKEFQIRQSFAYTVVAPDESMVLGCVYINPTDKSGIDAEVYLWIRQSHLASGMETRLYQAVREWVQSDWPFAAVAYPGRSISLAEWREIESI